MCELACSFKKEGFFSRDLSRIHHVRLPPKYDLVISCLLCEDPPCVRSCPREALIKSEKSGVIIVKEDLCNGCHWCVEACSFGALTLHPNKKVVTVCDLCDGDPECVKYCMLEALEYTTFNKIADRVRRSRASTIA